MIEVERPLFGFIRPVPPGPRKRAELRCRVLEVLAASVSRDVALAPVMAAATDENRGFARRAFQELHLLLDAGSRLGAALRSCTLLAFPDHTVAAVEAAEGTPRLAGVLSAAAADDAAVENRRASIWTAAFYPLLVVALVGGIAGGLIGPTRNRLADVIESMDATPSPALAIAAGAGRTAGFIALGAALLIVATWLVRRVPSLAGGLSRATRSVWQSLPGVRGASRIGAAARTLRALEPCVRAGMPLHESLRRAADAAGCRAIQRSTIVAASRAAEGASLDEVAAALAVPPAVRARFALAATRDSAAFAGALHTLADDCTRRYGDALDARMRWFHPIVTVFVGALVLTQLLGIFAMLEIVRRQVPTW